ncbi:hypothetical protein ScPMuIL_004377 [Solemya velum]
MDFLRVPAMLGAGVAALSVAAYFSSSPKVFVPPVDLSDQTRVAEDGSHISPLISEQEVGNCIFKDVTTCYEALIRGLRVSQNGPCLGVRSGPNKEYEWMSYQQVFDRSQAFGSGLIQEGLTAENTTFLGIYSINRPEFSIAMEACAMFSMVVIPLYDTLGADACKFIIDRSNLSHVVCDTSKKAMLLLDKASSMPSLKCLIIMDEISGHLKTTAAKHNIQLLQFSEVEPPKPSDLAVICYTSGTTGDPKGAMLTHKNIIATISAVIVTTKTAVVLGPGDCHISYLPLAHVFEIGNQTYMLMLGVRIGFYQGDPRKLPDDMQALKPTVFCTVPRLLNRIYDKVLMGVKDSWIKSTMLEWGMAAKEKEIERLVIRKDSLWDKLVFGKIQNLLGGSIRIVLTGSAPLEGRVLNFVRSALGCVIIEGYGQTESGAGLSMNLPGETIPGHVGVPLSSNRVKLIDVPDMEYRAVNGQGEICCKGPNVFIGYFKDPEKTKEAIDENGWLHTGDIGEWLPNGGLRIIDRKKNIFKLAQGEYVAPEKIENVYMRSKYVAQAYVDGDSLKHYLLGVIIPDEEYLQKWSEEQNNSPGNMKSWCSNQTIKDLILKDILKTGSEKGLKSFEQVKDIHLHSELFSVENSLLTPTFKNKRPYLKKYFLPQFDEMYAKNG